MPPGAAPIHVTDDASARWTGSVGLRLGVLALVLLVPALLAGAGLASLALAPHRCASPAVLVPHAIAAPIPPRAPPAASRVRHRAAPVAVAPTPAVLPGSGAAASAAVASHGAPVLPDGVPDLQAGMMIDARAHELDVVPAPAPPIVRSDDPAPPGPP